MNNKFVFSQLGHTWIFDLDGTVLKHNGYKIDGKDTLLSGAKEFFDSLPKKDFIVFMTSRTLDYKKITERFLQKNGIRYDEIVYGLPFGERILINDKKPSGLKMTYSVNSERDIWCGLSFTEDKTL